LQPELSFDYEFIFNYHRGAKVYVRMQGSSLILNIQMQFTYLVVLHILCDVLKMVHNYRVVVLMFFFGCCLFCFEHNQKVDGTAHISTMKYLKIDPIVIITSYLKNVFQKIFCASMLKF